MRTHNQKGKPRGNNSGNAIACQSGGATSAAKMNARAGSVGRNPWVWLWVPREGWVRWKDLYKDVTRAYEAWRVKKSLEGVLIMDGRERVVAEIREAEGVRSGAGRARAQWLREWQERHAELCRAADGAEERESVRTRDAEDLGAAA